MTDAIHHGKRTAHPSYLSNNAGSCYIVSALWEHRAMIKRIFKYRLLSHAFVWLGSWAAFYLLVYFNEGATSAFKVTAPMMLAGPMLVYAHFESLTRFFERRRYFAYCISLVVIVPVSSIIVELLHAMIDPDPNSHTNGLGIAIFFVIISTGFRYFQRGMSLQYRLQEAEFKRLQAEMALLRSQINPHFLFNALNSIYALSLDRSNNLSEVILKLSDMMRYLMDGSRLKTVPLSDEIIFIKNYVELEKQRMDEGSDVHLSVRGDSGDRIIAPMLMVPIVENCFKHGMRNYDGNNYIRIEIEILDDRVCFTTENNKNGQGPDNGTHTPGMGLENLQRRLILLYEGKHRLTINEEKSTYKVEMVLWL